MHRIVLAVSAALILAGCSGTWSSSNVTPATGTASAATSESESETTSTKTDEEMKAALSKIQMTEKDITDRPYQTLAELDVTVNKTTLFHADPTRELVREKLKEEAAKLDADAVVLIRYGTVGVGLWSWGSLEGKGRAVKFTK